MKATTGDARPRNQTKVGPRPPDAAPESIIVPALERRACCVAVVGGLLGVDAAAAASLQKTSARWVDTIWPIRAADLPGAPNKRQSFDSAPSRVGGAGFDRIAQN